jgi:hypothetical protein
LHCIALHVLQVAGSAGKVLVSGLSRVDSWLEARGLLGRLQPAEVPAAVQDEDGQLNEECQEVGAACAVVLVMIDFKATAAFKLLLPHAHSALHIGA